MTGPATIAGHIRKLHSMYIFVARLTFTGIWPAELPRASSGKGFSHMTCAAWNGKVNTGEHKLRSLMLFQGEGGRSEAIDRVA
jgi:hypothetical protein